MTLFKIEKLQTHLQIEAMRADNLLNRPTFIRISGEDDHLLGKVLKQKKTADEE